MNQYELVPKPVETRRESRDVVLSKKQVKTDRNFHNTKPFIIIIIKEHFC